MSTANKGPAVREWDHVRDAELELLRASTGRAEGEGRTERTPQPPLKGRLVGLAFSGGGIRAASFSLGVFQALTKYQTVRNIHYLSTVSGGGYMGAAISWLRLLYPDNQWTEQITGRDEASSASADKVHGTRTRADGIWLDYVRHHGNYLQPPGLGITGLIGVGLRNLSLGIGVYVMLFASVLASVHKTGFFDTQSCWAYPDAFSVFGIEFSPAVCGDATTISISLLLLIPLLFVLYSLGSFAVTLRSRATEATAWVVILLALILPVVAGLRPDQSFACPDCGERSNYWAPSLLVAGSLSLVAAFCFCVKRIKFILFSKDSPTLRRVADEHLYTVRVLMQEMGGIVIFVSVLFGVLALLPLVTRQLRDISIAVPMTALIASVATTYRLIAATGVVVSKRIRTRLWIYLTFCVVMVSGVITCYFLAEMMSKLGWAALASLVAVTLFVAFCTNLNQFGIGRMYRDRLMETFMPNKESIKQTKWMKATRANTPRGLLAELWKPNPNSGHEGFLYPIMNTNVVLVDSKQDAYRGRGGDSFILSPAFCGSDATKWVDTSEFAGGDLKSGTAMAISGAAANPNTAPGGVGFSRDRLVSFLMFLAQARLGAWVTNPTKPITGLAGRLRSLALGQRPNFLVPGLRSGLFGKGLSEEAYFLELTDGGHFDNTGAYELIRRRVKLLIVSQASQDAEFGFADLANLAEKIRVDFGARLYFTEGVPLQGVIPSDDGSRVLMAEKGHAVAQIRYDDGSTGWLVYLQATPLRDLPVDVHSYHYHNRDFPNEPTANQFFREAQLEAYRQLGHTTAKRFLAEVVSANIATHQLVPGAQCYKDIYDLLHPRRPSKVSPSQSPPGPLKVSNP